MKFLLVTCVVAQLLLCNCKSLKDLPSPCRKSDPSVEKCLFKATEQLKSQLAYGIPAFNIPSMDPYEEDEVHIKRDFVFASIDHVLRNLKVTGLLNYRVDHFKADVNNLRGEVATLHPQITVKADFDFSANILDIPLEFSGSITTELVNVKSFVRGGFHTNTKLGQTTFVLDDLSVKMEIGHAYSVLTAADPKQQAIADYMNKIFTENERRILDLTTPMFTATLNDLIKERANKFFATIPVEKFLIE